MITLTASKAKRPATVYCSWFRENAAVVNGKCVRCGSKFHGPSRDPK